MKNLFQKTVVRGSNQDLISESYSYLTVGKLSYKILLEFVISLVNQKSCTDEIEWDRDFSVVVAGKIILQKDLKQPPKTTQGEEGRLSEKSKSERLLGVCEDWGHQDLCWKSTWASEIKPGTGYSLHMEKK
jgi:hypothetical protein